MNIERDLERMAIQEQRLCFARFDNGTAWELGTRLKSRAEALGMPLTIEVRLAQETLFFFAMAGTTPGNADWVRRKRNAVELLHTSSYSLGRTLELEGTTLAEKMGLPMRDFAVHGGGFPIRLSHVGCIGAVAVSGAPQREDHGIVVAVLAEMCDVPHADVALD